MYEPQYLTVRHGVWHFIRRVPLEYANLDKRANVKLSTKVQVATDRKGIKAGQIAARMNETVEAYWRGLSHKKTAEAKQTYLDAVKLVRSVGLDYQTPSAIAMAPIEDVLARIETLIANGMMNNAPYAQGRARWRRKAADHVVVAVRRVRANPAHRVV